MYFCRILLVVHCLVIGSDCALTAADDIVMWNRDRSASFPGESYPWNFDGETGKHILWKSPLPSWSNSSPIVHRGADGRTRVFLTSEPTSSLDYHPWLLCFDAISGRELWRHALDAVAAYPTEQQAAVRQEVKEIYAARRAPDPLLAQARTLYAAHKDDFQPRLRPPAAIATEWQELVGQMHALGYSFNVNKHKRLVLVENNEGRRRTQRLKDLGFPWDHWGRGWTGVAFGSPVSDGTHVYTLTSHNLYSCHSHDGSLVWQRRFPRAAYAHVAAQHKSRLPDKRWRPDFPGQGSFTTSPVLADGLLLSCAGYTLRALEAQSGALRWEKPYVVGLGQGMGVPAVLDVDGERVLIAVGDGNNKTKPKDYPHSGDEIVRVRDGATLGYLPAFATRKGPSTGVLVHDGLVIVGGHAVRLQWNDKRDGLVTTTVWRHKERTGMHQRAPWIAGKVYVGSQVWDMATGTMLVDHKRDWQIGQGYMGHGGFIAGPAYVRWNLRGGKYVKRKGKVNCAEYVAWDRESGELLGVGRIPVSPLGKKQHWVGAATPFVLHGRIYIRSFDYLWCAGKP